MAKAKKDKNMAAPENVSSQVNVADNSETKSNVFVVVRDGVRVSDKEYASAEDPVAVDEREFWNRVATNHSHGEKVQIVPYDPKKHRIW